MEFGIVGLGKMGRNLSLQALDDDWRVVGFDKLPAPRRLVERGLVEVDGFAGFREELSTPRIVLLYVPAGPIVDEVLDELLPHLEPGDLVADGGNSYWGDSIVRHERLESRGLHFIDLGTSGGIEGARHDACFMAGGSPEAYALLEPLLVQLAAPGGVVHAGPAGAGHFVKLVHNGIEFGMLQAIAEGVDLLERYPNKLDIAEVLRCWGNGSVIRGWLIELMEKAYRDERGLDAVPAYVEDTGEVNWLVSDAINLETPIPVIAQAVMQLFASRDDRKNWARAIAMMRHGFGGHPYGADKSIRRERREGRVGPLVRGAPR
jgi:6-phosphogluconate dehydrogenase